MRLPVESDIVRMRSWTADDGYTLVELMIVFAIVGVLVGVAGSQYMAHLDRARTAKAIIEIAGIAAQITPMPGEDAIYPDTLVEVGITQLDPWGNPYQYLLIAGNIPAALAQSAAGLPPVAAPPGTAQAGSGKAGSGKTGPDKSSAEKGGGGSVMGQVRKDRFQVPINSDFDLYSMGPDGESRPPLGTPKSRDDIIRANDGAYYGVAADF